MQFRDAMTGNVFGNISEAFSIDEEEFSLKSPPAALDTKAIIEFSYNKKEWTQILTDSSKNYSYTYYNAPKVGSVSPTFGPVKSPNNESVLITGQNFNCPDPDCKDLWVRFGDPENGIL